MKMIRSGYYEEGKKRLFFKKHSCGIGTISIIQPEIEPFNWRSAIDYPSSIKDALRRDQIKIGGDFQRPMKRIGIIVAKPDSKKDNQSE